MFKVNCFVGLFMLNIRKKITRMLNKVDVTGLESITPVSRVFGFDRGMPIDRYYVEKFLSLNKSYITGNILEIGDSTYSRKFAIQPSIFHVMTKDIPPKGETVVSGDLTCSDSLPNEIIDCFICTQTLNFIYDVEEAIRGCYKILAPGGVLLATVSGLSQISRYDMERWGDYWRFTDLSIRRLFESVFEKEKIEIISFGNIATVIAELQGLSLEDLPNPEILDKYDADYPLTIGILAKK